MIVHFCQCTGERWTDELENWLTLPLLETYTRYWREFPPTHVMVQNIATWLGAYKGPPPDLSATNIAAQSAVDELQALFPNGIRAQDLG